MTEQEVEQFKHERDAARKELEKLLNQRFLSSFGTIRLNVHQGNWEEFLDVLMAWATGNSDRFCPGLPSSCRRLAKLERVVEAYRREEVPGVRCVSCGKLIIEGGMLHNQYCPIGEALADLDQEPR